MEDHQVQTLNFYFIFTPLSSSASLTNNMQSGLSIIIVNYNSTALVLQCLSSFLLDIRIAEDEVIIVDNDSNDNAEQRIKAAFPTIRFFQMGYNAGFARANNKGMKTARYATVLLLNADTIMERNAITACYNQLIKSDFVACGVQLLNADRTTQISGSRVMKGGLNYLLPLPYLGQFLGWLAKRAQVQKPSIEQAATVEVVDWINGAFIMVKQSAIQKAGMLDEDFFLYMEEIEWCSRLRKQGRLVLYGNINVVHLQGETTKNFFKTQKKGYQNLSDTMGRQLMLSIWVRQRKEFGLGWFFFLMLLYGIEIPVFLVLLCFSKLLNSKAYSFADFSGYTKNYWINLRYVVSILRNRPHFYKVI